MSWVVYALVASALWSITNHIDKYILGRFFKGSGKGAVLIFISLVSFFVLPLVLITDHSVLQIDPLHALIIFCSGIIYMIFLLPYMFALSMDEASVVIPMFQLIPVFTFILGYFFLGERLNNIQILASLIIIAGAIGISLEFGKKVVFKKQVVLLMLLASLLYSLNSFLFKAVAVQENFSKTLFWEYTGITAAGLAIFLFYKPYRKQFLYVLGNNKVSILSLNTLNETLAIIARASFEFATLMAPLALVWVVNGFQPVFVFGFGIILTLLLPKFVKEDLSARMLLQKGLFILLITAGAVLLGVSS
jgi:uncharacterized membrane protein